MKNRWNHRPFDREGRFRGGKTAAERGNAAERRRNQEARGEYTRWCKSSESRMANTAAAVAKFPLHTCNGKKSRRLRGE